MKYISVEDVRAILRYEPDTGLFFWRISPHPNHPVGSEAGSKSRAGYRIIALRKQPYPAHRLAFVIMMGRWPAEHIDHINRDRFNNVWSNLREATVTQNLANRPVMPSNSTGVKGVTWSPRHKKYQARIRANRTLLFLGLYQTIDEAKAVYDAEAKRLYGEFANV